MAELTRREQLRLDTILEIKQVARRQIEADGAGSLSLGKIAREMNVTTPALYRYFDNRDALVTALKIDAYDSMADWVASAVAELPHHAFATRLRTLLVAYREWALANPAEYVLGFGNPLADYEPPLEQIMPHAVRSLRLIASLLASAEVNGQLTIPTPYKNPPARLDDALELMQTALGDTIIPAPIITLALMTWLQIHALVWQELDGQLLQPIMADGALYRMEVGLLTDRLGLIDQ